MCPSIPQINTDTNAQRPVLRIEIPRKLSAEEKEAAKHKSKGIHKCILSCETKIFLIEVPPEPLKELTMMNVEQASTVIKCCTQLLTCPNQPPEALHANLRLCLRLTRRPELAGVFVREGGPKSLLSLTQKSSFLGFSSLSMLIFRHCLEEGPLLRQAMEGVVKQVLNPANMVKEGRATLSSREIHYVMRKLGPAACRDLDLFKETAMSFLRLSSAPTKPESYTTTLRTPSCNLRLATGLPKPDLVVLNTAQENLINLLIDHLCTESLFEDSVPPERVEGGGVGDGGGKGEEESESRVRYGTVREMVSVAQRQRMRRGSYRRQIYENVDYDDDVASVEMNIDTEPVEVVSRQTSSADQSVQRPSLETDQKPLLSKSAILRLLAELVDSYPSCAKLIAESSRNVRVGGEPAKVSFIHSIQYL